MGDTLYPEDFRRREIDAEVTPFPMPEMTPPETNIYLVFVFFELLSGTINYIKLRFTSQICYIDSDEFGKRAKSTSYA